MGVPCIGLRTFVALRVLESVNELQETASPCLAAGGRELFLRLVQDTGAVMVSDRKCALARVASCLSR